jgi:hypothetical protein
LKTTAIYERITRNCGRRVWIKSFKKFDIVKYLINYLPIISAVVATSLFSQKKENKKLPGKWVFPGGGLAPAVQSGKWIIQPICK